MATRKKPQAAKKKLREGGLLRTESRKQWDWEIEKAGSPIKTPERRESKYTGDTVISGAPSHVLYTCPPGTHAKLIYAALSTKTGRGYLELLLKGNSIYVLHTYVADNLTFVADYQDGIDLVAGDTIIIHCDPVVGNETIASAQLIEEEFSSGYVIPT